MGETKEVVTPVTATIPHESAICLNPCDFPFLYTIVLDLEVLGVLINGDSYSVAR